MCKSEWARCAFQYFICLVLSGAIVLSFFLNLYEKAVVSVMSAAFNTVVILDAGHGGLRSCWC